MTARAARPSFATARPGSSPWARRRPPTEPTAEAPKRVVVTGGAGLVGRAVVRVLRERGDTVVALVRDPGRAPFLAELGAELVTSDLATVDAIAEQLQGADAVIHAAGSYRVGITK